MCDTKYMGGGDTRFVFSAIPSFPEQAGCRKINLQAPWYKKGFAEKGFKRAAPVVRPHLTSLWQSQCQWGEQDRSGKR